MPKRFTDSEKWRDPWFSELGTNEKILFLFLCDICDIAGFHERNDKADSFYTGIPVEKIPSCYENISKSVALRDRWVFVKNFIRHQKNLPLNVENNCHRAIIEILKSKEPFFSEIFKDLGIGIPSPCQGAAQPLPRGLGKGRGKGKGKEEGGLGETIEPPAPKEFTPIQKVVRAWKMVTGYDKNDTAWDKLNFARCTKSAKGLIDFLGDWETAIDCMDDIYTEYTKKGLSLTLETIVKHAADWKMNQQERSAKNGILPR